jgi:hypothetical protein
MRFCTSFLCSPKMTPTSKASFSLLLHGTEGLLQKKRHRTRYYGTVCARLFWQASMLLGHCSERAALRFSPQQLCTTHASIGQRQTLRDKRKRGLVKSRGGAEGTVNGRSKCGIRTCNANHLAGFNKTNVRLGFAEGNFRNNSRRRRAEGLKVTKKSKRRDSEGKGGK